MVLTWLFLATFPSDNLNIWAWFWTACSRGCWSMLEQNESGVDVRRFYRDKAVFIVAVLPCLAYRCRRNDIDTMVSKKHAMQILTSEHVSTSPIRMRRLENCGPERRIHSWGSTSWQNQIEKLSSLLGYKCKWQQGLNQSTTVLQHLAKALQRSHSLRACGCRSRNGKQCAGAQENLIWETPAEPIKQ